MTIEPIDAVITWVDSQEPLYSAKRAHYFSKESSSSFPCALPRRDEQCGELSYCVMSLLHFAPWIRTIYIVTDAQIPPIIDQLQGSPYEKKIKLVDHHEIFRGYEDVLPTFNSITIECMLWRIPGLSNKFIYLNDDCMLLRPVVSEDFFQDDRVVIRGQWKVQTEKKWRYIVKQFLAKYLNKSVEPTRRDLFRTVQENSARLAGYSKHFFHSPHQPFGLKRDSFERYFDQHPNKLYENISYSVRNLQQFWPISLIKHLDIKENKVIIDSTLKTVSFNGARHSLKKILHFLNLADRNKHVTFLNMQDLSDASEETRGKIFEWLDKPRKSN